MSTAKMALIQIREENTRPAPSSKRTTLLRLSVASGIGNGNNSTGPAVPNRRSSLLCGHLSIRANCSNNNVSECKHHKEQQEDHHHLPILKSVLPISPVKIIPTSPNAERSFTAMHMPFDSATPKSGDKSSIFQTPNSIKSPVSSEPLLAIHSGHVDNTPDIRSSSSAFGNMSRKQSSFDVMINVVLKGSTDSFPVHRRLLSDNSIILDDMMKQQCMKNCDSLLILFLNFRHFEYFFQWLYTNSIHLGTGKEFVHATDLDWNLLFELYDVGRRLRSQNFQNHVIDMLWLKIEWYGAPPLTTANLSYTESTQNTGLRRLIADSLFDTRVPSSKFPDDKLYSPVQGTHSVALLLDLLHAEQEQREAVRDGRVPVKELKTMRKLRDNVCFYHDHDYHHYEEVKDDGKGKAKKGDGDREEGGEGRMVSGDDDPGRGCGDVIVV